MALRDAVLQRDAGLCQMCLARGVLEMAVEVDHIVPLHQGGTDDASNLQALCHDCHATKTATEQGCKRGRWGEDGWPER